MSNKRVLGFLVLLQNAGLVFVTDHHYPLSFRSNSDWYRPNRKSDFEKTQETAGNSDRNPRRSLGLYNVQTGDEFYMSDFVMKPKFKTHYDKNAHKIDFEYFPSDLSPTNPPTINCTKVQQDPNKQTSANDKKQVSQPNRQNEKNNNKQLTRPSNKNKHKPAQPVSVKGQNRRCVKRKPNGVKVIVACSNQQPKTPHNLANRKKNVNCNKTKLNCSPTKNRVAPTKIQKLQKVRGKQGNRKNVKNRTKTGTSKTVPNYAKFQAEPETNKGHIEIVGDVIKKYLARLKQKFYGIRGGKKISEVSARNNVENRTISLSNNLLSLFTVIQVHNFKCKATGESGTYDGKCYYAGQCKKLGGTAVGECVNGFGVCCVFVNTCGGVSGQNCSFFQSPGYPDDFPNTLAEDVTTTVDPRLGTTDQESSEDFTEYPTGESSDQTTEVFIPDPRNKYKEYQLSRIGGITDASLPCTYRVYKISNDVQQMRIDFIDLELAGPTDGECVEENLAITGQNLNTPIPTLCGYNSGQHVYVDVSSLDGPLQISVVANSASNKRYKIRICQFSSPCSNSLNCLQYHTGVQGVVSSFNYDQASALTRSNPEYLNNLNYAICIRRETGYCSITYDKVDGNGQEYSFELLNIDSDDRITVADGQPGKGLDECPDDYVVINSIRFCGEDFDSPITDSTPGPIVIPVRTNDEITGRGFKLFYTQNKCPL